MHKFQDNRFFLSRISYRYIFCVFTHFLSVASLTYHSSNATKIYCQPLKNQAKKGITTPSEYPNDHPPFCDNRVRYSN